MAKSPQDSRRKYSKLQDLLPSLTNEEIEEMYQNKIKLALDKSMTSTYQIKNLEEDINILAQEMKVRNTDMRARSPSRKSKILPYGSNDEKYKTLMDIEKKIKQRAGYAAKQVICPKSKPEDPKKKSDSATSNNNSKLKQADNKLLEEKRKVTFNELTELNKDINLKLQLTQYYKPKEQRNEWLEQITHDKPRKELKELKKKQLDYNMPQKTEIGRQQIHCTEPKMQEKPLENDFDDTHEEENLYTLVVGTAGRFKVIETLYQNTILEDDSDFALIDGSSETISNPQKKPVNDAERDTRTGKKDENSINNRKGMKEDPFGVKDEEGEASALWPKQRKW